MGHHLATRHHVRDQVFAKIVTGCADLGVRFELGEQVVCIEHIHTHAGQCLAGVSGHGFRVGWFFLEPRHFAIGVDGHDTKGGGFIYRNFNARYRARRAFVDMVFNQACVVHFVNMVTGQNKNVLGCVLAHDVQVLENGVGCAQVPRLFIDPLLCR